ncbi:MAG: diaminopimelate epimerase [Myxococcales bacterium]|nr:diaminopimelate epimerase [Myxococcales bacterium]
MQLRIEKWHGLGNDFVIVRAEDLGAADVGERVARMLCDRRRGVGGDGVLAVSEEATHTARMIVRNADGSRPEMCGNGLRCVVGWLASGRELAAGQLTIATDAGERACRYERESEHCFRVGVAMGRATVSPFSHGATGARSFVRVDVGNPHVVSFDAYCAEDLQSLGPAIERGVPGGVNVELARLVGPGHLETLVWERGVGRTAACGTGACAVAAAAATAGLVLFDEPVTVELPGGALTITVGRDGCAVDMLGPAVRVFTGVIEI